MKVRHVSRSSRSGGAGEGEVRGIGPDGVLVEFAGGAHGLYDDGWFQYTHVWLEAAHIIPPREDEIDGDWAE